MTAPEEYTRQQAADPATPQQVLADIAALRPDLRPVVALNPAAYPGLLEWLGSLGEPGVDSALGERREREAAAGTGSVAAPPWVAPEATAGAGPASQTVPPGSAAGGPTSVPVPGGGPFAAGPGAYGSPHPQGPQDPYGPAGFAGGYAGGPGVPPGAYGGGRPGPAAGYPAPVAPKGSGSRTVLWIVLGVLGALLVVGVVVVLLVVNLARGVVEDLEEQGFTLEPQQGQTYGDNPELDALWDACAAGDMEACDELYFSSEAGSEYEDFGDTCGGTTGGGSLCAQDEPGASGSAGTYGDDPELDALWDACAAGDMGACDELYFSSGVGTEYEAFGETCGRTQEGSGLCAP